MTNLTEKWKKGELILNKCYYLKLKDGTEEIQTYVGGFLYNENNPVIEVLGIVPSYELWKAVHEQWKVLLEENVQLKKWCEEFNALEVANENEALKTKLSIQCGANEELRKACKMRDKVIKKYEDIDTWWQKENRQLKELLKECRDKLDTYYEPTIKRINQVLGEE